MEMFGGSGKGGNGNNNNSRIPFEAHLARLAEPAKSVLLDLRNFVLALGENVIEDVRPHRVVYSKTMNFRIFLDVEPAAAGNSLVLSIRSGRAAPPLSLTVQSPQDAEAAKQKIAEAYQKIQ
ncbi:MAG TPA: hypothetical protein VJP79_08355 [Nitrososphaera sp.]|nr:hypothetical protein [Nitrososphaera sp.]